MKRGYEATRGRLIVDLIPMEKEGLVELPDSVKDAQAKRRARILAVGPSEIAPDGHLIEHMFTKGSIVVLSIYTQPEHLVDDVFAVRFAEVLAIEIDAGGN